MITFSEELGLVYFTKAGKKPTDPTVTRIVHVSACAWIEIEEPPPKK